jgi:rRNA processing protein Krr1/Pno1
LVYKCDYKKEFKNDELRIINEHRESLRNNLKMLTVKQINSPDEKIKLLGIISAVKLASTLVVDCISDSQSTDNRTITLEMIPQGPIKEAAELVELMMSTANGDQEILCMLYDEMSNEFKPKKDCAIMN